MAKTKRKSSYGRSRRDRMVVRGRADGLFERVSAHDRYQLEIKRDYVPEGARRTRYEVFTYLFLPHTLGISSQTYKPADFYRDLQNYIRLRTPRLSLKEIFKSEQSPLVRLERLADQGDGDFPRGQVLTDLKLLFPVARTALGSHAGARSSDKAYVEKSQRVVDFWDDYLRRVRGLQKPIEDASCEEATAAFRLAAEALSLTAEQSLLERHEGLERFDGAPKIEKLRLRIRDLVALEQQRRKADRAASGAPPMDGEDLLERFSLLKKFSSGVLHLQVDRKPEGKAVEHLALAAAAGIAMAFATVVTFLSQSFWHSFSLELFSAFVCGYMFKDRIKEIARGWFASKLTHRLDDHRLLVSSRDGRRRLGYMRERVRFQTADEVPAQVMRKRRCSTEHAMPDALGARGEVVLFHRREIVFNPSDVSSLAEQTPSDGLCDIARLDVRPFLAKMDDPQAVQRRFRGDHVETVRYQRTYTVYLVTAIRNDAAASPMPVSAARVLLNRKGVRGLEPIRTEEPEAARSAA